MLSSFPKLFESKAFLSDFAFSGNALDDSHNCSRVQNCNGKICNYAWFCIMEVRFALWWRCVVMVVLRSSDECMVSINLSLFESRGLWWLTVVWMWLTWFWLVREEDEPWWERKMIFSISVVPLTGIKIDIFYINSKIGIKVNIFYTSYFYTCSKTSIKNSF